MSRLCAGLAALVLSAGAWGQEYPTRPIRILVPFAPGGATDVLARYVAQHYGQVWGQQVVVDNRPGANGIIAAEMTVKAAPDGHTLLFVAIGHAINSLIYKKLPYDTQRDFTPVSLAALYSQMLLAHPAVPAASVKELIALAKTKRLTYASGGVGSSQHLAGALFGYMAKVDMSHVPYKGGAPALVDVMAGNVDFMLTQPTNVGVIKAGKLKALAVSSPKRSASWPDVPTISEAGLPGYESQAWYGMVGPRGLPPAVLRKLNDEMAKAIRGKELRDTLAAQGGDPTATTPAEFAAFIKAEINRYAAVVREAGITAE
jgi:tripartite-type tricarboxylate transporter receptor subunit TctC